MWGIVGRTVELMALQTILGVARQRTGWIIMELAGMLLLSSNIRYRTAPPRDMVFLNYSWPRYLEHQQELHPPTKATPRRRMTLPSSKVFHVGRFVARVLSRRY